MEVGVRSEDGGIELATALGDGGAEVVERGEMPIGDWLIHQRPEMLGRLEFGGIGWQEDQADPLGDGQAFGSMPAVVVEHEDDAAVAAGPGLAREGDQELGKEGLEEAWPEIAVRPAAGR